MSRNDRTADRRRRSVLGVGTVAGAAFAAALISMGTAPSASADPDLDPFQDLYGFNAAGINSWTHGADTFLAANAPALATTLDGLVDSYNSVDADPLSDLVAALDPQAFSPNGFPTDYLGDLAVTLDYGLLWPTGLGALLDPVVDSLLPPVAMPALAVADLDPFQDLFGTGGINTWTTMADNTLATLGLAGPLDGFVDNFLALPDADPFTDLVGAFDPSAFGADGLPVTAIGDFAVGLDYMLSFTGAGATLDPIIDNLLSMLPAI